MADKLEQAMYSGPRAPEWRELENFLSPRSFASIPGNLRPRSRVGNLDIERRYNVYCDRRLKFGSMSPNTHKLYTRLVGSFMKWMDPVPLAEITTQTMEDYYLYRMSRYESATPGPGLLNDATAVRGFLTWAIEENFIPSFQFPDTPLTKEADPTLPFSAEEMDRIEGAAQNDRELLTVKILRWTGMRRSDAASLRWSEVDRERVLIRHRAKKNQTLLTIPIAPPLWSVLKSGPEDGLVLEGMTGDDVYVLVRTLGERAKVGNAHPHRYRDSLAVWLLSQPGTTIYDVAKILGDTVTTTEKHYAPFVDELQSKVRGVFEKGTENV
jgi:integrase